MAEAAASGETKRVSNSSEAVQMFAVGTYPFALSKYCTFEASIEIRQELE